MADSSKQMVCIAEVSVTKVRRERQKAAKAESANFMQVVKSRLEVLEEAVAQISAQMKKMLESNMCMPPGLHDAAAVQQLQGRVERLETLLVCSLQLSPEVDAVLAGLLETRLVAEPDRELSPITEMHEMQVDQFALAPTCLNFDAHSETDAPKQAEDAFKTNVSSLVEELPMKMHCGTGQVGSASCPSGVGSGDQFAPKKFLGAPANAQTKMEDDRSATASEEKTTDRLQEIVEDEGPVGAAVEADDDGLPAQHIAMARYLRSSMREAFEEVAHERR